MSLRLSFLVVGLCVLTPSGMKAVASPTVVVRDSLIYRAEVERIFAEGLQRFEAGDFHAAANLFDKIAVQYPLSQRITAAYLMGAKAHFRVKKFWQAEQYLETMVRRFPESSYRDEADFTLGLVYYQLGRYHQAGESFLKVLQITDKENLRETAESAFEYCAESGLSDRDLRRLLSMAHDALTRAIVSVSLAEKVAISDGVQQAIEILQPYETLTEKYSAIRKAQTLLHRLREGGAVKLGVLVPLMKESATGAGGELGRDVLDGIRFAVERHNASHLPKVTLVVSDTERNPSMAARQMTELTDMGDIAALIGPMFSNQVFASAGIANARGIPVLTPTATSNGIAAIGPYVFQANPDYNLRGRAMAQFAIQELNAQRLAVVAPVDAVGKLMAEAFVDEAKQRGVEVVEPQWYQAGATDLRAQLSALREQALKLTDTFSVNFTPRMRFADLQKLLQWGVPQRRLDSLVERNASVPVELLFGKDGKRIADSLKIPLQRTAVKYDSLGIPVQNIDAIFLPIARQDEIGIVTSQLKYFNFQTQLLGTGDWQDLPELDQNRQYADGVVFSTDYYPDVQTEEYQRFALQYQSFTGRPPSESALFGYDAAGLLLNVLRAGATSRNDIAQALSRVRDYAGYHSKISFSDGRVNSFLILLQFKKRTIIRIGDIIVE